eukprot:1444905-Rhodomonas_salina.1
MPQTGIPSGIDSECVAVCLRARAMRSSVLQHDDDDDDEIIRWDHPDPLFGYALATQSTLHTTRTRGLPVPTRCPALTCQLGMARNDFSADAEEQERRSAEDHQAQAELMQHVR